ncbi:uncharacterized protein [Haliotis cracherodii]|uniref:uncharacterized protein n=1 Tax=Haliotis cracherodii TaxID=6455 RepID=UPI0039E9A1C5
MSHNISHHIPYHVMSQTTSCHISHHVIIPYHVMSHTTSCHIPYHEIVSRCDFKHISVLISLTLMVLYETCHS